MDDRGYNPVDPEFLLSRSLDESLGAEERQVLEDALRRDAGLLSAEGELRRLDGLVKRIGRRGAEVDWRAFERLVLQRMAAGEPDDRLDEMLARWGEREPGVDEQRFVEQVTARIEGKSGRRSQVYRLIRVAVPLAAAAAIALVVLLVPRTGREDSSRSEVVSVVRIGPGADYEATTVATSVSEAGRSRAVVAFGRTPTVDDEARRSRTVGITVVSAGMPVQDGWSSAPPL